MGIFTNNGQQLPQRAILENQYHSARFSLILMVICSAANVLLSLVQGGMYLLFSASIPFFLSDMGAFEVGLYHEEYYEGIITEPSMGYIFIALALTIVALYFVCWVLSKKNVVWLIVALVMFIIDTFSMFSLYVIDASIIIDVIFHIWVVVSLIIGVVAHFKLKKLPPEQPDFVFAQDTNEQAYETTATDATAGAQETDGEATKDAASAEEIDISSGNGEV